MRTVCVHEAVLRLEPGADERAPGAAVTVALCGSWEHSGPCPVAPHHSAVRHVGDTVVVRVLFAVDAHRGESGDLVEGRDGVEGGKSGESTVREMIVGALAEGNLPRHSDGQPGWQLLRHGPDAVADEERDHAARLAGV